jgi:hypothetical protein
MYIYTQLLVKVVTVTYASPLSCRDHHRSQRKGLKVVRVKRFTIYHCRRSRDGERGRFPAQTTTEGREVH